MEQRANRRRKLTDRFVETVRPPKSGRLDVTDLGTRGLVLRIMAPSIKHPAGLKSWAVRYRPRGFPQRRETIGAYPAIKLKAARQRALAVVAAAYGGADLPSQEEQQRKQEAAQTRTVGDLL